MQLTYIYIYADLAKYKCWFILGHCLGKSFQTLIGFCPFLNLDDFVPSSEWRRVQIEKESCPVCLIWMQVIWVLTLFSFVWSLFCFQHWVIALYIFYQFRHNLLLHVNQLMAVGFWLSQRKISCPLELVFIVLFLMCKVWSGGWCDCEARLACLFM